MFPKADIHPIVFDEVYILDNKKEENNKNANKTSPPQKKKRNFDPSNPKSSKQYICIHSSINWTPETGTMCLFSLTGSKGTHSI